MKQVVVKDTSAAAYVTANLLLKKGGIRNPRYEDQTAGALLLFDLVRDEGGSNVLRVAYWAHRSDFWTKPLHNKNPCLVFLRNFVEINLLDT